MIWLTFNYWTTWRSTTRWTRTFEGLRGARMFHLVSLSLQISLTVLPGSRLGLCVCVCCFCCLFCWVGCWFLSLGKFVFNHRLTPVVDRPSLALVRQCRKKKYSPHCYPSLLLTPIVSPHFSLASYPPRHRLPCIVSRLLSDCPRAGLFAATTLSRPWNSVATTAWLGLALAASCAFYTVFASPSQDKMSGI